MFLRNLLLVVYGLSAGALIAGSFLAFLSMIGVVPRLAGLSKTISHAMLYETCITLGGVLGTAVFIYRWHIPLGYPLLILYGLFGGIFTGCLIGALAEMLKSLPVFSRRMKLRDGIPFVIYSIALGKIAAIICGDCRRNEWDGKCHPIRIENLHRLHKYLHKRKELILSCTMNRQKINITNM